MNDFKGLGPVKINDQSLESWTITGFPLSDAGQIEDLIRESSDNDINFNDYSNHLTHLSTDVLYSGPIVYHATFNIDDKTTIHDTYLDPRGWGKVLKTIIICVIQNNQVFSSPAHMIHFFLVVVLFSGYCIYQWIQFGTVLATCWPTNYIIFTERAVAQRLEFTHSHRIRKGSKGWKHTVQ